MMGTSDEQCTVPADAQSGPPPKAKFVSRAQRSSSSGGSHTNLAAKKAVDMMKSQRSMVDAELTAAFDIVRKQSVYLPNFFAQTGDLSLLNALLADLERHQGGMVTWSKHMKHENPDFSPTFLKIIERMQVRRVEHCVVVLARPRKTVLEGICSWLTKPNAFALVPLWL